MIRKIEYKNSPVLKRVFIKRNLFRWFPIQTSDGFEIINDWVWKSVFYVESGYLTDGYSETSYYAYHPSSKEPASQNYPKNPNSVDFNKPVDRECYE